MYETGEQPGQLPSIPTEEQILASHKSELVGAFQGHNLGWVEATTAGDTQAAAEHYYEASRLGNELARRASHPTPDLEGSYNQNAAPKGLREPGVFHRVGGAVMRVFTHRNGA
jgi:hypothetical protein